MRTIGLLGGLSSQSTKLFYDRLIQGGHRRLQRYPEIIIYSVDLVRYKALLSADVDQLALDMAEVFCRLHSAGAEVCLLTALSMHRAVPKLRLPPSLELVDLYRVAQDSLGEGPVLVVGTRFIMEDAFSLRRLAQAGREVLVPGPEAREEIEEIITKELNLGIVTQESRQRLRAIVAAFSGRVRQVLVACTTLPVLMHQEDYDLPLVDVVDLSCERALLRAQAEREPVQS